VGNAVEWYDWAIYGAFASVIALTYFPPKHQAAGLTAVFAAYAIGFLVRPVGAIYFGRRGDRTGRRRVMVTVVVTMALATAAIGVLPRYATIGVLAPVLLVLLRATQGFSAGGEVASAAAFAVEHAPERRRGWYGSWQTATVAAGVAAGLGTAAVLTAALPRQALLAGWWRTSFLLALPLGLVGLQLRLRLVDTPGFQAIRDAGLIAPAPVRESFQRYRPQLAAGFAAVAAVALAFNTFFIFLPVHLSASARLPLPRALGAALIGLAATAIAAPVAGRISDAAGRRPVMITAAVSLAALAFPMYALAAQGSFAGVLAADVALGLSLGSLVLPAFLSEMFPTRLRATCLAISFCLATALFGGTAPVVDMVLLRSTHSEAAPALYCTVIAVVGACAVQRCGETAFRPLPEDKAHQL
jgi:MFS transporter, MHS family, proline/betaine transporter